MTMNGQLLGWLQHWINSVPACIEEPMCCACPPRSPGPAPPPAAASDGDGSAVVVEEERQAAPLCFLFHYTMFWLNRDESSGAGDNKHHGDQWPTGPALKGVRGHSATSATQSAQHLSRLWHHNVSWGGEAGNALPYHLTLAKLHVSVLTSFIKF